MALNFYIEYNQPKTVKSLVLLRVSKVSQQKKTLCGWRQRVLIVTMNLIELFKAHEKSLDHFGFGA